MVDTRPSHRGELSCSVPALSARPVSEQPWRPPVQPTILVAGASLASYATTGHGHGAGASAKPSGQPKTITFHLGKPGQKFHTGTDHVFAVKVPQGNYSLSQSGIMIDSEGAVTPDSLTCVLTDEMTLLRLIKHPGSAIGGQRLYLFDAQGEADSNFGVLDGTNPVVHVDRSTIAYGCVFTGDGTDTFTVVRPAVFTLTPVKVSNRQGTPLQLPQEKVRDLARALR
jgi:hypothetical protein